MDGTNAATKIERKGAYYIGIAVGILGPILSLFEPKVHGLKLRAISLCAVLAALVSLLKLRR